MVRNPCAITPFLRPRRLESLRRLGPRPSRPPNSSGARDPVAPAAPRLPPSSYRCDRRPSYYSDERPGAKVTGLVGVVRATSWVALRELPWTSNRQIPCSLAYSGRP